MIEPWMVVGGGFAAVVGAAVWLQRMRDRKRREAYAEFSLIRGYMYEPQRAEGARRFREAFEVFQQGGDSWRNTITGTKNRAPFTAFEYVWHTGSGKSRHKHVVSGLVWERDDVSLPRFTL